jgi:polyisoprenoid-binding protein YceI
MKFRNPERDMTRTLIALPLCILAIGANAAPVQYNIDPNHTYPSFAADHMGGLSIWRGKLRATAGTITLDRSAHTGTVDVTIDVASIDFDNDKLNEHAKSAELFDVAKYPTATYHGTISKFNGDAPTEIDGNLTLHGVTKPVKLTINSFLCKVSPMNNKEKCGADASATLNRADFGITFGQQMGFKMDVKLDIQVEATPAA